MAYNPFNVFRRNQKAIFAVVTVIIMFTFVLSSGLGGGADFFDFFPQWLGSKSRKGDVVATVDGSKLYSGELDAIRRQRVMANRFMSFASEVTQNQLGGFIRDQQSRMSSEGRQVIDRIQNMERQMAMFGNNPQIIQMVMQQNMQSLQQLAGSDKSRPEDKEVANAALLSMELAQRRAMAGGSEHYFVNLPNQTQRDAIEFMIWEKKADQLGIRFTSSDVKALIQKEFMRQFGSDVPVRKAMEQGGQPFSMDACLKAIAAEFRVRAAQTVVIGPVSDRTDRTTTAAPIYNTPFELYQFYREQCSPTTYQMLAVPAANFTELVSGTPTDDELEKLFRQYKDVEPNPAVDTPGFKTPRQIKVEWLSAKGDEPFYKQAAAEWLGKSQFANFVGLGLAGSGWDALAAAPVATNNSLLLESDYDTLTVRAHKNALMYDWGISTLFVRPLDTSVVRPENLAAAAGAAAGAISSFGMNFGAAATFGTRAISAEQRARIAVGMPSFLGGVPGPGMFATMMAGEARSLLAVPKPLPLDVVRPQLQATLGERTARKFVADDLKKLNDQLNNPDLVKNKDKSDAKKLIADFLAKRNLPTGKSADGEAGFRDEWNIGEEAGLAPVKEALEKADGNPHGGVTMPVPFGKRFFWGEDPRTGARQATRENYRSEFYPSTARDADAGPFAKPEAKFLVWRTEDKPAASVAFGTAKPKVLAAWKRTKARDLAKQRAEDIAAAVRKDTLTNDMAIRQDLRKFQGELLKVTPDPKAADRVKLFELAGVCPLAPVVDIASGAPPGSVQRFSLPPSTNIPYPTADMAKTLLAERANPVKTTVVLTDAAKDTYYVAVVSGRAEMDLESFKKNVYAEGRPAARQMVVGMHQMELGRKAQESILGLLKKEFKYAESDDQKQKLDENQKKGGES